MATAQATVATIIGDNFIERGDWTKERHEKPERSAAEVNADILRLQTERRRARMSIEPATAGAKVASA